MAEVVLENVGKVYDNGTRALTDLSLTVRDGEFLVLVGPSGCGKTTTLRLIAGLEDLSTGVVRIGGKMVNDVPARQRNVAMVFQRPALFPNKTVRRNLEFGERLRHPWSWLIRPLASIWGRRGAKAVESRHDAEVQQTARVLGLENMLDRFPHQLSGGQQQRVALGRALLRQPAVFLLDEPLSHLDVALRLELRRELHLLQRRLPATMIYVTHDPTEALNLGDRIAVLHGGVLQQVDRPEVLRERPANRFVAEFVGILPMNSWHGRLQSADGRLVLAVSGAKIALPPEATRRWQCFIGQAVTLGIHPEEVAISGNLTDNDPGSLEMTVEVVEGWGPRAVVTCTECGRVLTGLWDNSPPPREGQKVMVQIRWQRALLFDLTSGRTLEGLVG